MLVVVYTFPILSKLVRLALIIASAVYASQESMKTSIDYDTSTVQVQIFQVIWFLTAFDNMYVPYSLYLMLALHIRSYASAIFLWKLQASAFRSQGIMRMTNSLNKGQYLAHS
jgi:hypothetical protein